jgi:hypothetical protein
MRNDISTVNTPTTMTAATTKMMIVLKSMMPPLQYQMRPYYHGATGAARGLFICPDAATGV